MSRYDQLKGIIARVQPSIIIEIGTHKGARARLMVHEAMRHAGHVSYIGFDIFDGADEAFQRAAMNGKGVARLEDAEAVMQKLEREFPGRLTWSLVQGDTRKTLANMSIDADLVFIDGDHRLETIRSDYEAVAGSRCIVFDDYYVTDSAGQMADVNWFGANRLVDELEATILPVTDSCRDGGMIRMAVLER